MPKFFKLTILVVMSYLFLNCSSDDDCQDIIEVDINDPESIKRAEACGLAPAVPLGTIWVSDSYRLKHNLKK